MEKDEHDRVEDEPVEDLDAPDSDAEEVKGGAGDIFTKIGDIKGESQDVKFRWRGGNHNETLVRL